RPTLRTTVCPYTTLFRSRALSTAGDEHRGPVVTAGRRTLRRSAPARLGGHGAGSGDLSAAARRTDHLPRPRFPDRTARPVLPAQPRIRSHPRRTPARPQPG